MSDQLTGDQLAVMTLDQIEAADRAGRVDRTATVACQVGHHEPKCKGRVIGGDYVARPCQCGCHGRPASA